MKKHLTRLAGALLALALLIAPARALTVDQALGLLEEHFYYDIPDRAYDAESLDELFWCLGDPYTGYYTPEELKELLTPAEHDEDAAGIGVSVTFTDQGILVQSLVDGNSAQQAGIRPGDLIVAVDGVSCVPADSSCRSLILGKKGTQVTVTVLRDGVERDYVLTRRSIYVPSCTFTLLEDGVGYLQCTGFERETADLFLDALRDNNSRVKSWVVDLRGNVGGYAATALDMLGGLNGPGRYIYEEYRDGEVAYGGSRSSAATDKPVLVLVDGSSASASELFTGNIRDAGRGASIGGRTYGKGIGQAILTEDEYPACFDGDGMKLTVFRYYTGGGTSPHYIGVVPTLLVVPDMALDVAQALCGGTVADADLCVMLGGDLYYVDPDADSGVLAQILSALPPQVLLFYNDGEFNQYTPAQAAEKLGVAYENRWFDDVADSDYAYAINAMGTYELLLGDGQGSFVPKGQLTRAQLCVMLARVLNVAYRGDGPFSDVSRDDWYGPSVNAMASLGLVNGVGEGRFNPDGVLTQEEFLTIMGRLARYLHVGLNRYADALEDGELPLYADQQAALSGWSDWSKTDVAVLAWGVEDALDGSGDMLYARLSGIDPAAPILREEAAAGMYKVLNRLEILP